MLTLDGEWSSVQAQTPWKLERCYKPLDQEISQPSGVVSNASSSTSSPSISANSHPLVLSPRGNSPPRVET